MSHTKGVGELGTATVPQKDVLGNVPWKKFSLIPQSEHPVPGSVHNGKLRDGSHVAPKTSTFIHSISTQLLWAVLPSAIHSQSWQN